MEKYNKEELEKLILIDKLSYKDIGLKYNCSGGNIKRVAKTRGINLPVRRNINPLETFNKGSYKKQYCLNCKEELKFHAKYNTTYCSVQCQTEYARNRKYELFLTNPIENQKSNYSYHTIKPIILKEQNNKCAICQVENTWNNKPMVFIMDHIDGNAANNTRENYRLICHNCDSQLDTYKSKNKNSARITRYKSKPEQ